eukprot:353182-Chlamydomonas_euryale.AAC.15
MAGAAPSATTGGRTGPEAGGPDVAALMQRGCPKASGRVGTSGAALALAVHCILTDAGFRAIDVTADAGSALGRMCAAVWPRSPLSLPPVWESDNGLEWLVVYKLGRGRFVAVTCALHGGDSGRFLVHALEGHPENPTNVRMLGLNLSKYIPADNYKLLAAPTWADALRNGELLAGMVHENICQPLLTMNCSAGASTTSAAAPTTHVHGPGSSWLASICDTAGVSPTTALAVLATAVAVGGVAAYALRQPK